ncbi:uracil-DNA glycosylase-like protein [Russula dissimulans]|nr:uracil-DNA glycosylase-like protein [Russula dissimulans]
MRLEESRLKRASARSQKKPKRGYAAPEVYAHLGGVPDYVAEELDVLFCGINPGYMTAVKGHHYANPTNHFWRCLHLSGFTPRLLSASEDSSLPGTYNIGLTNLLARPSTSITELSKQEMADSVPALLANVVRLRPRVVCFVGKGIWLHVERSASMPRRATARSVFAYGLQPYKALHDVVPENASVRETLFYVFPSTSGRVVSHQLKDKVKLFKTLKQNLEPIKAGNIDTSTMSPVRL